MLEAEPLPGAANTALNLVDDQQPAALVAQVAQETDVSLIRDIDAAFALQHFHHYGGDAAIRLRRLPDRRGIVVGDAYESRYERFEAGLRLRLARGRKRRPRAPVPGALHHHDGGVLDPALMAI